MRGQLASSASNSVRDGTIKGWITKVYPEYNNIQTRVRSESCQSFIYRAHRWARKHLVVRGIPQQEAMAESVPIVSQPRLSEIQQFYMNGEFYFKKKDYKNAETLLKKMYTKLETAYPELEERVFRFTEWQHLLNLFIVCQFKLKIFDSMENRLMKIEFDQVSEILLDALYNTVEVFISACCGVERLDVAASLATKVINIQERNGLIPFRMKQVLSEIYLRQNDIDKAEQLC